MGNNGSDGVVTPFGVEVEEAEAANAGDALSVFLQDGALLIAAATIIGVFLIYQFGRWYLSGQARSEGLGDLPLRDAQPMAPVQKTDDAEDENTEPETTRMQRPWQVQQ